MDDWILLEIESTDKIMRLDGILGLSPLHEATEDNNNFVNALYDAGKISEMIATFQL